MPNTTVPAAGRAMPDSLPPDLVSEPFFTEPSRLSDIALLDELTRIRSMINLLFNAASAIADKRQVAAFQTGLDSTEFLLDRVVDEIDFRREEAEGGAA